MPKLGFAKDDMYAPSGRGFVETIGSKKLGEIISACARFTQWQANKKTGAQIAPLTSVFLGIKPIDASGASLGEPVEQELVVEWGPKDDSMIRVRPGIADSASDDEPDDTVNEAGQLVLGSEGNCLFAEEGTKINMTNSYGVFVLSCQEKGFKPAILSAGFLPDFVGMRAWFDLKPGRQYTNKDGQQVTTEDFVVAEITKFPYEKASAPVQVPVNKPIKGAKAAAKAQGAGQAPAPVPVPATNGATTLDTLALSLLSGVARQHAGDTLPRQKVFVLAMTDAMKQDPKLGKEQILGVQNLIKDQDWFYAHAGDFGGVATDNDQVMLLA